MVVMPGPQVYSLGGICQVLVLGMTITSHRISMVSKKQGEKSGHKGHRRVPAPGEGVESDVVRE